MARVILFMAITIALGGCMGGRVTQVRAVECLKMSFAYRNLERDAGGPVEVQARRDPEERILLNMVAHRPGGQVMVGRFRVELDGRMFQYQDDGGRWMWITTCD